MRAVLTILVAVVLLAIVGVATGFINLKGDSGKLPDVAVSGGDMPTVKADVGSVDVGTTTTTLDVPTVGTRKEDVDVPTVSVKKPGE